MATVMTFSKNKHEIDPVERSVAKPDAFSKPAAIGKPGSPTNQKPTKDTRIRTMDWKRTRGRPRKTPFDKRKVRFFWHMKSIPLTQGMFALVDDSDFDEVVKYRWQSVKIYKTWYASGRVDGEHLYLHRFLIGPKPGEKVDHRDRNGLNNCRDNLRICTMSQNQGNRGKNHNNKFGFKGIHPHHKKWIASMSSGGKSFYIGLFDSPEEAAKAYDSEAELKWGEFAMTNKRLGLL